MYKLSKTCQINDLDSIYLKYFGYPSKGTFVEVGAYDGESFSNTSCLADFGWRGIYIEPVKEYCELCLNRHKNNNVDIINCGISSIEDEVDIYIGGALTTLDTEHVKMFSEIEWSKDQKFVKSTINVFRLDRIFLNYNIPPNFDVLVVDVEGKEEDVFNSFDLNFWKPKMILVELVDQHKSFQKYNQCVISHKNLRNFIIDSGYTEIYKDEINTIFIENEIV